MKRMFFFTSILMVGLISVAFSAEKGQDLLNKGKAVYEKICVSCHSYTPPPKTAPPIMGITQQYHEAFNDGEKAIAHMVEFLKKPSKEKSSLNPVALERWGIMPPVNLSDEELYAVSYWIWEAYPKEY